MSRRNQPPHHSSVFPSILADRHELHRAVDHDWPSEIGTPSEVRSALVVIAVAIVLATIIGVLLQCGSLATVAQSQALATSFVDVPVSR